MSIYELKILFDLDPESKPKVLDKYAKKFRLGYFFVDSEDGCCYLFDEDGNEKDVSLIHEINENMIPKDIKKIVIPNKVINILENAFYNCIDLISVTIPDGMTSIGNWAFCECYGLTNVKIPNSVTSIGDYAFFDCRRLMSMTIPNSVTSIGKSAFWDCSGLTSVTISNNIKSIGSMTFYYCNNLKSLVFKNKTIDQVKAMENYPFGIKDESIIKVELS